MKTCTKCRLGLPVAMFYIDKQKKDGLRSSCKSCTNSQQKQYYIKNTSKVKVRTSRYYEKNRDGICEKNRTDLVRIERRRAWCRKNTKKRQAVTRAWEKRNPEKKRAWNLVAKSRRRASSGSHTVSEWSELIAKYDFKCLCCDKKPKDTMHRDHIIPIVKGGSDFINNLQPLCGPCNLIKGTKTIDYTRGNYGNSVNGTREEEGR